MATLKPEALIAHKVRWYTAFSQRLAKNTKSHLGVQNANGGQRGSHTDRRTSFIIPVARSSPKKILMKIVFLRPFFTIISRHQASRSLIHRGRSRTPPPIFVTGAFNHVG